MTNFFRARVQANRPNFTKNPLDTSQEQSTSTASTTTETDSGQESTNEDFDDDKGHQVNKQSHNCATATATKKPLLSTPDEELQLSHQELVQAEPFLSDQTSCIGDKKADTPMVLGSADEASYGSNAGDDKSSHKLETPWSVFYRANKENRFDGKCFEDARLARVETVEEFWSVLYRIKPPSNLFKPSSPNVSFFRKDIQPKWEDSENSGGGTWTLFLKSYDQRQKLDYIWYEILLGLVGETFGDKEGLLGNKITGVVLQRRNREDRIQIWTKDASDEELQNRIRNAFKLVIDKFVYSIPDECRFIAHNDSMKHDRMATNTSMLRSMSIGSSKRHGKNDSM